MLSPMTHDSILRVSYPKSFLRLLLTGFLLISLLLGGALVKTVFLLEKLAQESQRSTYEAVQLTQALQVLDEQAVAMERSARQYLLLEDVALLHAFQSASSAAQETLQRILRLKPSPVLLRDVQDWQRESRPIAELLLSGPTPEAERQQVLYAHFAALARLNRQLLAESQRLIDLRLADMRNTISRQKRELAGTTMAVIGFSMLLALGFGVLISRPIRQLDHAIRRLGDNELEQPVFINGPADLAHLGQRLDWLRQRLQDLEAEKSRFLHHMSHELKTPLAAMREGAELLSDEVAGILSPGQRQIVRILRQNSLVMQKQIEDLLNYNAARFATSQLQLGVTALHNTLVEVLQSYQLQMRSRQITVDLQIEPIEALCDAEKMHVIFDNLISNAVKFSPEQCAIRLRLALEAKGICFDCIDSGPGILSQERGRVFEPFFQGSDQPHSHVQGSGIGLSIAREYAELHGGTIELIAADASSSGTHFRVRLPYTSAGEKC